MSHNEKRGHWTKEGLISMGTGVLFGATYVAFSHVRVIFILNVNVECHVFNNHYQVFNR